MESKKINQLATELAPDLSDLTIIGDPTTGISKKITLSQMASLFTGTVEEYANFAAFPLVGVADTIYIAKDTNVIYRWDSTAYVVLSPNIIASLVFSDANGFDGTISLVGSVATLTITTALTSGSVPFIGASGALTQDNSNLFFDDTNNRLGIATASPTTPLDVFGSGIIGRLNATSTNNSYLGFASNGTNKWSAGNVQSDHRFRIFSEANSAELITILQTGEFGIGISNPTTKFHIDGAASALIANLDANVSIAKSVSYRSDNSARINLEVSGTESGSNAGADFFLRAYSDAGSLLNTPLTITRATGAATFVSSVTATALIPTGSSVPTNGMYLSAANTLNFATNTTNRFSIDSTGAATFNGTLQVTTTSNNGITITTNDITTLRMNTSSGTTKNWGFATTNLAASDFGIYQSTSNGGDPISAGTAKLYFSGTGNVGIGTTSPTAKVHAVNVGNGFIYRFAGGTSSEIAGGIFASTATGFASIGTTSNNNFNIFTNDTDRLTITSGGEVLIGTTTTSSTAGNGFKIYSGSGVADGVSVVTGATSNGGLTTYTLYSTGASAYRFYVGAGGTVFATNTTISAISDQRLKENIQDLDVGLKAIMSLKPRKFDWKEGKGKDIKGDRGWIAQEFEQVFPDMVDEWKDPSPEGENAYKSVRADLIPVLVKAIQEMNTKLDEQNQTIQNLQEQINILSK